MPDPTATGGTPDEPGDDDHRPCDGPTDYTDPSTIDVDEVIGNINHAHRIRGHMWTDERSWPNVTVKALAAEVERLRAAAPASGDDGQRRTRLVRERLVAAIDAHVAKTHEPLTEGTDPATAAALFSEDSVELLLKAAELLRAGSPPPTPGPTREQVEHALSGAISSRHPGVKRAAVDAVTALLSTPATVLWEGPIDDVSLPDRVTQLGAVPPGTHVVVTRSEP